MSGDLYALKVKVRVVTGHVVIFFESAQKLKRKLNNNGIVNLLFFNVIYSVSVQCHDLEDKKIV